VTARSARVGVASILVLTLSLILAGCSSSAKTSAPDPPTDVKAAPSGANAKVSFTAPDGDGGSPITTYTAACSSPEIATKGAQAKTSPITVPGLSGGHTYACVVSATNANGTSDASEPSESFETTAVPGSPTAAGAVPYDSGVAKVTWDAPKNDGGSPVTGYVVTPYQGSRVQPSITYNSTATTQLISGLPNGKAYTFAVKARNAVGTSAEPTKAGVITIGAPGRPGSVTAVKAGAGSVTVSFTAPSNNGAEITSYTAACTPTKGGKTTAKTGPGQVITLSQRAITLGQLVAGTTYTCTAKAHNSRGVGPLSAPSKPVTA
jgi:Fibronectin type III domain